MLLLAHPDTCAVVQLGTGTYVGKTETKSTVREWTHDARYHRNDQREERVTRLSGLEAALEAVKVREDELLASGFVPIDGPEVLAELLAHHDPWKTWRRAASSGAVLVELWKGLAAPEALERASVGVTMAAVQTERLTLATPMGELFCERPLAPDELGEAPSFLIPLLARHASLEGVVDVVWNPLEELLVASGRVEFQHSEDDGALLRWDVPEAAPLPATLTSIMAFVLERVQT